MLDRYRFPATSALLSFWALVPLWIETEDAPSTKRLPAGAHAAELEHWTFTHRVWDGYQNPAFVQKRIGQMSDEEFRAWARMNRTAFAGWLEWLRATGGESPEYGEGWHGFP